MLQRKENDVLAAHWEPQHGVLHLRTVRMVGPDAFSLKAYGAARSTCSTAQVTSGMSSEYLRVSVCVCARARVCVCVCVRACVCMRERVYECVCLSMRVRVRAHESLRACVHVCFSSEYLRRGYGIGRNV
jgi:hypothetical protein